MKKTAFIFLGSILFIGSCSKDDEKPGSTDREVLSTAQYNYVATSPEIGALGRTLFYDKTLSKNGTISCGSCHKQEKAFADDKPFSVGFNGELTTRNSPPIQNLTNAFITNDFIFSNGQALFWDGRTRSLQDMVFEPVTNHIEMGLGTPTELLARIRTKGYYKELFFNAFGSEEVNIERVGEALGGFVGSMFSSNSPFEQAMNSFGVASLPPAASEGFNLFVQKYDCMSCHDVIANQGYSEPMGQEFANIGLTDNYADPGRAAVTGNPQDIGKFKIPNLRNVALTAPYMHDGSLATLEEVIDHYSHNVANHANLDTRLKGSNGAPKIQNITPQEKQQLIAFLESLSDPVFTTNPAFSDPFSE